LWFSGPRAHNDASCHICRIVFYDTTLFLTAIDKVSFEDFLLSDDFSLEDGFKIHMMTLPEFPLALGFMWMKDAVIETLFMVKSELLDNAANVGNLSMCHLHKTDVLAFSPV